MKVKLYTTAHSFMINTFVNFKEIIVVESTAGLDGYDILLEWITKEPPKCCSGMIQKSVLVSDPRLFG